MQTKALELPRRSLAPGLIPVARLGLAGSYGIGADDVERAFHELSINYFFVSPRMKGLTEGVRRLVRAGHRDQLVIASGASIPTGGSVAREWEKVARSLEVDRIDVFHLFWIQARWYVRDSTWTAMAELKAQGKATALAISCHDRPMARELVDELALDVLMIRYNAAHRGAEQDIFDRLEPKRPGIVAYTATRWGRLLKPAQGLGPMTAAECYRFALTHPAVNLALCGAGNLEELRHDAEGVLLGPLSEHRLSEVHRFGDAVRATATGQLGFSGV